MFTPLHPPAKLCYVPIVQCDVGWSARVQMLYTLLPYLSETNTFLSNTLWLAGCHPTSGKNNKAVNVWSKGICLLKIRWQFIFSFLCVYVDIYIVFSMTSCSSNKVASLTSVIFLNMVNKLSSLN